MSTENDDLTEVYAEQATRTTRANDVTEVQSWVRSFEADQGLARPPLIEPVSDKQQGIRARELPAAKPVRQVPDDELGRVSGDEESTAGKIARNVGEIPKQVVGGIDDAVRNIQPLLGPVNWMADWFNNNVIDTTYDPVSAPKTGTGAVTRKLSEFFTGFVPAMRGLRALGMTSNITTPMLAGAIADFTVRAPHEGRLADLWKEMGGPENVLTEYLASKPDDSAMEARFKNSLEGMGLGVMAEGVFLAARTLRAARAVKGAKEAEIDALRAKYGELTETEMKAAGMDVKRPIVSTKPPKYPARKKIEGTEEELPPLEPRSVIRGKKGEPLPEDFEVYINFSRIDEPDQIKFAMGKLAEAMKGNIDEAKRGVITQAETKRMADDLGMTVEELLGRRKGVPFNAEEAVAARRLWAASAEELVSLAKSAAGPNAGPLDQFAFRRAMAVHSAIQAEVLGARAEAARGLASWKIPAGGGDIERARAVEQMMQGRGGDALSKDMAKRLALLAEEGASPAAIAKFAERGAGATTMDAVREVWVNGLLSSPKTHAVNIASNTLVALSSIYERMAAAGVRKLIGGEGTEVAEAGAMAWGMIESFKDAFRLSAKALRTGETHFGQMTKVDTPRTNAISSEAFRMSRETGMGRAVDFIGTVTNVPTRLLGAEDEFFKTIGYRMELRAQAVRTASQEGHVGRAYIERVEDLVRNPPEHIRINAVDAALYNTFTSEVGAFGRQIMNLRNIDSPWNPMMFILPFVRTPVNIARFAFERTPFAPLVSQWRADVAAGGARADLALARMSTGTAIMLVAMDYADSGICSGEGPRGKDQSKRETLLREGWQPYSCKIGDRWYSYNRLDPFGMTLGFASSISEAIKKGEVDQDDVDEWQEVAAMTIAAVSQVAVSKTYLEGFAKFVEVLADPKRYSQSYIQQLFASFVPATSLNSAVKNMVDPVQREVNTPAEAIQARIAGLSKNLPPRRTLWGDEITSASGLGSVYDFVSPVTSKPQVVQPIDKELMRLQAGPERITKQSSFDGVKANMRFYPQVYDDYVRLAGNELKHPAWGMGAKDYLNSVVSGNHPMSAVYRIMSDESQKSFIQSTISEYRKLAQRQILGDPKHKAFAEEIGILKQRQRDAKMPVLE